MKNSKIKKLKKKVKKSAQIDLEERISTLLKDAVIPLGIVSKKSVRDINKASKALSKKLIEGIKFKADDLYEVMEETEEAFEPKQEKAGSKLKGAKKSVKSVDKPAAIDEEEDGIVAVS